VALFKAYPPSPTEQAMIGGLRRQGVNVEIHVLAEGTPIDRSFLRRIRESDALLFHMCDATPKSKAVLTVDWLGSQRPVSSGVLDLARLLDAPIMPVTYQSHEKAEWIDAGPMISVERVRKERSLVLQEIMAAGERQIRSRPEQWQLWHDWHQISAGR
jgi:lauroyl/myristoyl acyltransferase